MSDTVSCSSPRWFAVYTATRHEKNVSTLLKDREVECFLPLYRTTHRWKNRTQVELELPLFPSYVFARITPGQRGKILSVPGVLSLVGSKREAWPLNDFEIEGMRSGLAQRNPEPHPYVVVGDRVRLKAGALAGMQGILVQKRNGLRMAVSLEQIMRSVSVEVSLHELEPVPPTLPRPAAGQEEHYA
jgi:transcription antitermination factor NusG